MADQNTLYCASAEVMALAPKAADGATDFSTLTTPTKIQVDIIIKMASRMFDRKIGPACRSNNVLVPIEKTDFPVLAEWLRGGVAAVAALMAQGGAFQGASPNQSSLPALLQAAVNQYFLDDGIGRDKLDGIRDLLGLSTANASGIFGKFAPEDDESPLITMARRW